MIRSKRSTTSAKAWPSTSGSRVESWRRRAPEDANWPDLFIGEEVSDAAHLNLAKIQMFFFTILLLISYGVSVASPLLQSEPIPDALPDVGEGMLALFGISPGGYLLDKAVPAAPPK